MKMTKWLCVVTSILVLCLATIQQAVAYEAAAVEDGPLAHRYFKRQVKGLLYKDNFRELEKAAAQLREGKNTFADGNNKLQYFYEVFSEPRKTSAEAWKSFIARLDRWRAQYPESVTARTALANAWMAYGWQARGGGYADKVTEEGWRLFKDRLNKAYSFASIKPKKLADDCPERYEILLSLAVYQGADRFHFESLFNEAISSFPDYNSYYYQAKAGYLRPSWHGSMKELLMFLEETAGLPAEMGVTTVYAAVITSYWGVEFTSFKDDGISWDLVKKGYLEKRRLNPKSSFILNSFCEAACRAGDKETAKELFREIGDRPYIEAWGDYGDSKEFFKCREWALSDDKQVRRRSFPEGTEDFRQMLLFAQRGDMEAQFQVGEMLARGKLVRKDPDEAATWYLRAAKQGYRGALTSLAHLYDSDDDRTKRDYVKAAYWYYRAAMLGDQSAASVLGSLYDGFRLEKDLSTAYVWYSQTAPENKQKKEIAARLTPEQRATADKEAQKLKETIRVNVAAAQVRPIDPDTILVPEMKRAPQINYEAIPRLKLPTGNLVDGVKWELSGGATFDGKALTIKTKGEATARMKVIPDSDGCVLVAARMQHSRPEPVEKGAPFLMANMMGGKTEEGQRIFVGLLAPPPHNKKEGPWYKTHEIVATHFEGVKIRFGTAGLQEGSSTELSDLKVIIFQTCEEAVKAGEEHVRQ